MHKALTSDDVYGSLLTGSMRTTWTTRRHRSWRTRSRTPRACAHCCMCLSCSPCSSCGSACVTRAEYHLVRVPAQFTREPHRVERCGGAGPQPALLPRPREALVRSYTCNPSVVPAQSCPTCRGPICNLVNARLAMVATRAVRFQAPRQPHRRRWGAGNRSCAQGLPAAQTALVRAQ